MRITRWNILAHSLWLYASVAAAQTEPNWTMQSPQTSPPPRNSPAIAYDAARSQVVLFGGLGTNGYLNDTWVWDGVNWTQKSPQTNPPPFAGPLMAYDAAHGQVVLFGGANTIPTLETWVWDGANWAQKSPQTIPPQLANDAMAYDSARGQVVLATTQGCIESYFNTWVWDGANWSLKSPQTSPQPLVGYTMAYDAAHGQIVLFGGSPDGCVNNQSTSDTWVWDGTNWTKKSPQTSPPARIDHAMTYDAALGQVVLFGGLPDINSAPLDDTWVWDGTNWSETNPLTSPPARDSAAMAYDSARNQVVMFGGHEQALPPTLTDTWTFETAAPPPMVPSIGSVVSASS